MGDIITGVGNAIGLLALSPPGWGTVMLSGALATIYISGGAFIVAIVIGLLGSVARMSKHPPVAWPMLFYVAVVRAVPELVLIVALYYAGTDGLNAILTNMGLPAVTVNGSLAAIGVLGFVQGAYTTEIIRGAILAIPPGHVEAARAFGMSPWQCWRLVLLPGLIPNALPGLANVWMNVTKDSALIAVVGYYELTTATRLAAGSTRHYFLFFLVAAGIYLAITMVSNRLFTMIENRYRVVGHDTRRAGVAV